MLAPGGEQTVVVTKFQTVNNIGDRAIIELEGRIVLAA
jgi:hypothetical protein